MPDPGAAAIGPGLKISARKNPISSRTGSRNCSTRNRSPAFPPGTGCLTRRSPRLKFKIEGEVAGDGVGPSICCRTQEDRQASRRSVGRYLRRNFRAFTLIINTLAKDKEISDRWRGFKDVADPRHLANRVESVVVEALIAAVRTPPRGCHTGTTHLKARWFGKEKLPSIGTETRRFRRSAPRSIPGARPSDGAGRVSRVFAAMAELPTFFKRTGSIWRCGPGNAGGFPHPTAPGHLRVAQLHGQAPGRDDARPRAGARRAPGLAAPNGPLMAPPRRRSRRPRASLARCSPSGLLAQTTDPTQRWAMLAAKVEDMINTVVRQIAFYGLSARSTDAATGNSPPTSCASYGCRCRVKAWGRRSN